MITTNDTDIKIEYQALIYWDASDTWCSSFIVVGVNNNTVHIYNNGHLVQQYIYRCNQNYLQDEVDEMVWDSNDAAEATSK